MSSSALWLVHGKFEKWHLWAHHTPTRMTVTILRTNGPRAPECGWICRPNHSTGTADHLIIWGLMVPKLESLTAGIMNTSRKGGMEAIWEAVPIDWVRGVHRGNMRREKSVFLSKSLGLGSCTETGMSKTKVC